MRYLLIALLLTGCASTKKVMKNCEAVKPPFFVCEEP